MTTNERLTHEIGLFGDEWSANVDELVTFVHSLAESKGWWDKERSDGELIALMHSELSEALEACLMPEMPKSDKIPEFTGLEEELADTIIRIMDMAKARGCRLGQAIVAKMHYNINRPHRHGGKKM